jgi:hypothetical protein
MDLILIILVLVLLFGGGFGYSRWGYGGGVGIGGFADRSSGLFVSWTRKIVTLGPPDAFSSSEEQHAVMGERDIGADAGSRRSRTLGARYARPPRVVRFLTLATLISQMAHWAERFADFCCDVSIYSLP